MSSIRFPRGNRIQGIKNFILGLGMTSGTSYSSDGRTCPVGRQGCKFTCRKDGGEYIYNCYRNSCNVRGRIKGKMDRSSIVNFKNNDKVSKFIRAIPEHFVRLPQWAEGMLLTYNAYPAYERGDLVVKYDPKLNRVVCIDGDIAIGRLIKEVLDKPKWYRYDDSPHVFVVGNCQSVAADTAVVVEDVLSAAAVSDTSLVGIALMGTELKAGYIAELKKYKKLIIALDKDATNTAIKIKKEIDMYCNDVVVLRLDKDLKDITFNERVNILV